MAFNLVKQYEDFAEIGYEHDQLALHTEFHNFKKIVYFNWQRLFNDFSCTFCRFNFTDAHTFLIKDLSTILAIYCPGIMVIMVISKL